jgi:hypothetical protein
LRIIFGAPGTQFLSTVSDPIVVYKPCRFQRQPYNWVSRMIFGTAGMKFWSTVSEPAAVYMP